MRFASLGVGLHFAGVPACLQTPWRVLVCAEVTCTPVTSQITDLTADECESRHPKPGGEGLFVDMRQPPSVFTIQAPLRRRSANAEFCCLTVGPAGMRCSDAL